MERRRSFVKFLVALGAAIPTSLAVSAATASSTSTSTSTSPSTGTNTPVTTTLVAPQGYTQDLVAPPQRDAWTRIVAPFATSFPRDHGNHADCRTEWWYLTGIASTEDGSARFGWQLTVFRLGLDPTPRTVDEPRLTPKHVFAGHLAIVDLGTGRFVTAERVRREVPGLAESSSLDMDVVLDGWSMRRGENDVLTARAVDRDTETSVEWTLTPTKPFVRHGAQGISVKGDGPGNASAYVSWTRLATVGTIGFAGKTYTVTGEAWFDHEWGSTQLGTGVVGWNWFGLRLADGRELMLYHLRRADGTPTAASSATLIERDGTTRHLTLSQFDLRATSTWTSPRSKAVYPSRWSLKVPTAGIDVSIATPTPDCEIDARLSTGTVYWEGPVRVEGNVAGEGYGELTGYADSMSGRF